MKLFISLSEDYSSPEEELEMESESGAKYSKGDRIVINTGNKKAPIYFPVTVTGNRTGAVYYIDDAGNKGKLKERSTLVLGLATTKRKRKTSIPAEKIGEWVGLTKKERKRTSSPKVELEKSTWKEFLANKKLMYIGSAFGKQPEEIATIVLKKFGKKPFKVNRTYKGGTSDIQYKTEEGTISHLSKVGKVFKYGKYFIIHNKADGDNNIVYRVK